YILDKTPAKGKFDARAKEGVLVGYSEITKGYRVWVHSDNRVVTARDVKFHTELDSVCPSIEKVTLEDFIRNNSEDNEQEEPTVKEIEIKPSKSPQDLTSRTSKHAERLDDRALFALEAVEDHEKSTD
ncbi:copia protein, partial [Lasius niger]